VDGLLPFHCFNTLGNYSRLIGAETNHIPEDLLIQRLRSRDKSPLEYLYDHYSGAIYSVILRIIRTEEIAEEVVQDVFLKYWNRIDTYDSAKGKLFTWMLNIARNQAIDRTRSKEVGKEKKTEGIANYVNRNDSSSAAETYVDAIGLKDVLKNLPPEQQFVVEYLYFRGYSQSEVAEEFNIPLGTVKTRLRLAMQQLRLLMAET
jgi:RNA polymerase sigma factor (sigma-70 family)